MGEADKCQDSFQPPNSEVPSSPIPWSKHAKSSIYTYSAPQPGISCCGRLRDPAGILERLPAKFLLIGVVTRSTSGVICAWSVVIWKMTQSWGLPICCFLVAHHLLPTSARRKTVQNKRTRSTSREMLRNPVPQKDLCAFYDMCFNVCSGVVDEVEICRNSWGISLHTDQWRPPTPHHTPQSLLTKAPKNKMHTTVWRRLRQWPMLQKMERWRNWAIHNEQRYGLICQYHK